MFGTQTFHKLDVFPPLGDSHLVFILVRAQKGDMGQRSWLRRYATSKKVVGSNPDHTELFQFT
jgi:hypothetical protein